MTTADKLKHMKEELQALVKKRNMARDSHDEPHFRWYAERAIKMEDEIRELEWEMH